ncbi:sensor histidine kinase [Azospirillum sp.]|uniref:sensor histidine kinase n=1 Tax=Azospirillum sp. TaxID=34012 RepID=UPI002D58B23F|nr:histidine kinase dimerization/phosphoacceptor domain -containing protein [Azospirillum sp.]HYD65014.1 histidine kinase dimerization/phosphoacceptor domain -containing protein [Azospirillum sp.]
MHRIIARASALRTFTRFQQYAAATAILAVFVVVRLALDTVLPGYPFLILLPAVMLIALLFDHGTGLYAAVLGTVCAWFLFIPPRFSFDWPDLPNGVALALYVPIALLMVRIIEDLRKAVDAVNQRGQDLQDLVRRLQAADAEKDVLLCEVNHRIKNDLQLVSAMLHLQGRTLGNPEAREALATAADRVGVMGRVHARLTRRDTEATVDMKEFLEGLCDDLRNTLVGVQPVAVRVQADPVTMPLSHAVPMGLVVNELLTNALKYAFRDGRSGRVDISMRREPHACELVIRDDGVGMEGQAPRDGSLGMSLVRSLVQGIDGTLRTVEDDGMVHTIRFPHPGAKLGAPAPGMPPAGASCPQEGGAPVAAAVVRS